MVTKAKRKGWKVEIDFEGVESGGFTLEDGTYQAEIVKAESKESSEGNPMIEIGWVVTEGKKKGTRVSFDTCSLLPQALWKIKSLLLALGVDVPDSSLEIEESDLVGGECAIEITNETYEGKKRPKVTGYVGSSDAPDEKDDKDDEDKPARNPKKASAKKDDDDDSDDDDDDDDKKPAKRTVSKSKFKEGQRVKFRDDKDKLVKGKVVEIEGDVAKVEDANSDIWELEVSDLEAA